MPQVFQSCGILDVEMLCIGNAMCQKRFGLCYIFIFIVEKKLLDLNCHVLLTFFPMLSNVIKAISECSQLKFSDQPFIGCTYIESLVFIERK